MKKKRIIATITDLLIVIVIDVLIMILLNIISCNVFIWGIPVCFVIHILYFTLIPLTNLNATPGMHFNNLNIYRNNGENAGILILLFRSFASFFSCLPLGLGFWISLKDEDGLTVYDYASGVIVRQKDKSGQQLQKAYIVCKSKSMNGRAFEIKPDGLIIGRNPSMCDVVMPADEPCVSRIHCQVTYNDQTGMLLVKDMGSSYGTFLNEKTKLVQGQIAAIAPEKYFYLGSPNNKFMFYVGNMR